MDLATGSKTVFVIMTLFTKDGAPKIVPECTYPLTGLGCVSRVCTDWATFEIARGGVAVCEAFGITATHLQRRLGIALTAS